MREKTLPDNCYFWGVGGVSPLAACLRGVTLCCYGELVYGVPADREDLGFMGQAPHEGRSSYN